MRVARTWLLSLFALCLASASAVAKPSARLSHRDRLYDVFVSDNVVLAVGYPGVVLRSTDGGKTFQELPLPTRDALFSIDMNDEGMAAAVGRAGLVLVSRDRGASWTLGNAFPPPEKPKAEEEDEFDEGGAFGEEVPSVSHLFDVDVLPNGHVVAVGEYGAIMLSEDGGNSWQRRPYSSKIEVEAPPPPPPEKKRKQRGKKGRRARARHKKRAPEPVAQVEKAEKEEDGWFDQNELSLEEANAGAADEARLTSVAFADDKRGWIVGEFGMILATKDGGMTWKRIPSPTQLLLFSVSADGADHVVVAGSDGVVAESHDGAASWKTLPTPTKEHLFGVSASPSRIVAVGARGTVIVREGQGEFRSLPTEVYTSLTATRFGPDVGFVAGNRGHLLRTSDWSQFELISGE